MHDERTEFRAVFESHYQTLVCRLNLLLHDWAAAEDTAQEAFIQLLKTGVKTVSHPDRWLLRVGTNLALNHLRSEKNRRAREMREVEDRLRETQWRERLTVEDEVGQKQEADECRRILGALPPRDRQILLLRHSGFSYSEIAGALGVDKSSVGTFLARATARFKREYQKNAPASERTGGKARCVLI